MHRDVRIGAREKTGDFPISVAFPRQISSTPVSLRREPEINLLELLRSQTLKKQLDIAPKVRVRVELFLQVASFNRVE